jgi:hypothetical protein
MIDCGRLPARAYVPPDGRWMFPEDYFQLYDDASRVESLEVN